MVAEGRGPVSEEASVGGGGARGRDGRRLSVVAAVFALIMATGTLPVPLYVVWGQRFGFGAVTTTVLFAVYAVSTALALAVEGRLSDQIGRRPVLLAALGLGAVGSVLFATATGTLALDLGRLAAGLATGAATPAATAALAELAPHRPRLAGAVATAANLGGLGVGAVMAGVLAHYAVGPTSLVFWIHLALTVVAGVSLLVVPETRTARAHPTLLSIRPTFPADHAGRRTFVGACALMFAAFAVNGMFASLVPAFLRQDLGVDNQAVAGATVGLLFLTGMLVQLVAARPGSQTRVRSVSAALVAGIGLTVTGLWVRDFPVILAGTVLAGIGFGTATERGVTTVSDLGDPEHRAELLASLFLAAYAGATVSTLGLGGLTQALGTNLATAVVAIAVVFATVGAIALQPRTAS
jgi:MFS family permease